MYQKIGKDTPSCSFTMSPRIPIMKARPLFISMSRLDRLVSSSKVSQPKSRALLRKSPGNSDSSVTSFIIAISRAPKKRKIYMRPSWGETFGPDMDAHPLSMDSKEVPEWSISTNRWIPLRVTICLRKVSCATRLCFTSTYWRRSNRSWLASASMPRISKKPRGAWAPSDDLGS